ncbi:mitochondrial ribosomal protein S25-domain-containing protein [Neohortaea acidophila]|uniref:Small ribosomal subunit protein mS23 n=1 Tax=Neohortaea acidophila TaxID=245834 RepID=A0A6A6PLB3_9PEZI|nr:mitochondrial ribosomal protein S25-domain-containing protein [Neohortaea acidophila]KAF2480057.1 mitochondrial ribosomal protein S25-domain-containing protein [Neohortaea acidophila]
MGRYNLDAHRVQRHATSLLRTYGNQHSLPSPWFAAVSQNPPPQILTRPPLRRPQRAGKRPSQLFKPVKLSYEEDKLRWEYFNDHPWELARPRIVLEDDGRDVEKTPAMWDWIWQRQSARPLNGESVIQRQAWLLRNTPLTPAAAYDKARKELYRVRHAQETERRIAKEEAQATGAFFGKGPLEVGMHLENSAFEDWKAWAIKESMALKQMQSAAYTGNEVEEADAGPSEQNLQEELQVKEIADAVPGSKRGQEVKGGAAIHP